MYATPFQRDREWFTDRRTPERRLQVTWHGEQRTTVLSIWHGDACAATFQLPVEENALLINQLVAGLSQAMESQPSTTPRDAWTTRIRRGLHRATAEIIPFRRR
jgi:hypothetical protein